MEDKFLMQSDPVLRRMSVAASGRRHTIMNPDLRRRLILSAYEEAWSYFRSELELNSDPEMDPEFGDAYLARLTEAEDLGLFREGGIERHDHVSLFALHSAVDTKTYLESGVFIGSSLHAAISWHGLTHAIGFDPDLSRVKLPILRDPRVNLRSDTDVGQAVGDLPEDIDVAFFDDHIDPRRRINAAWEAGVKYVVFDDAVGLYGMCQRLFPAVPPISMIMHPERWRAGDSVSWTYRPASVTVGGAIRNVIGRLRPGKGTARRSELVVTEEMLDSCRMVRRLVAKQIYFPDLRDFIPQGLPRPTVDARKILLKLKY